MTTPWPPVSTTGGPWDLELPRAIFDPTRRYRYLLRRFVQMRDGRILFVLLNPSTADEAQDDPTIRRCYGFTRSWDLGLLEVVNIFALRSTDPAQLYAPHDAIGRDNDQHIAEAAERADLVVCGWGEHGAWKSRGKVVLEVISEHTDPAKIRCLDINRSGEPKHPLYVAADRRLRPYP